MVCWTIILFVVTGNLRYRDPRVEKVVKEEKQITSLLLPFSSTPLSDLHVLSTVRFVEFLSLFSNFPTKIYICQLTKVLISRELTNDPFFFLDSVGRINF